MSRTRYQIEKVMNNNVILCVEHPSQREVILVGKGLGFGKKDKMFVELEDTEIEKSFLTFDKKIKEEYFQLFANLDDNIIGVSEEIIALAEQSLGKLNEHIHILLTDHIGFALERIKMNIEINNPFLFEIKTLYPQEFEIGKRGAQIIEERLGIKISEDEMGFIALYLNASRLNKTIKETVEETRLLKESVEIIEKRINYKINPQDPTYIRLINHLRLKINRITEGKCVVNPILDAIKAQLPFSFNVAREVAQHIQQSKKVHISEDELGYMAIHIERVKNLAS